jgi:hypothetical protein
MSKVIFAEFATLLRGVATRLQPAGPVEAVKHLEGQAAQGPVTRPKDPTPRLAVDRPEQTRGRIMVVRALGIWAAMVGGSQGPRPLVLEVWAAPAVPLQVSTALMLPGSAPLSAVGRIARVYGSVRAPSNSLQRIWTAALETMASEEGSVVSPWRRWRVGPRHRRCTSSRCLQGRRFSPRRSHR